MSDTFSPPPPIVATGTIPLTDIIIPPRSRQDTPAIRIKIENELAPSIAENGLAQPILLNVTQLPQSGKNLLNQEISSCHILIAGWSRLQAFHLLGRDTIPYNYYADLQEHECLALELEENLRRNDMTWQEVCLSIERTHRAYVKFNAKLGKKWGQRQTGALMKQPLGYVSEALLFAKLIANNDQEIIKATTYSDARRIISLRKEDEINKELARRHKENVGQFKKVIAEISNKSDTIPDDAFPPPPSLDDLIPVSSSPILDAPAITKTTTIPLSSMLFHMDSVFPQADGSPSWFDQAEPESIDLIYTDHPFAIDMSDLQDLVNVDRVEDEHDVEENLAQMPLFLRGAYRVLRPNSYLLFFMDMKHWEKLVIWATEAGFDVQPYPNIWIKTHSCKNKAPHAFWTKAIEYVMVCRKGKACLSTAQTVNFYAASNAAERREKANPFVKPADFTKWLLSPVIRPGMTALDCYAGEGSLVRPMIRMGLNVIAVEKKEIHYNRLIEHVKAEYESLIPGKLVFV